MWKVSQILKVRDRSQGMGQTTSILLTGEEDLQSQKRFDLPQSDHDFNTVLDTKTDSRFHKTSSNSSSSQSKQLPPQYLTFLKTTTKTSKRNKNVLREENYSPCCIITTNIMRKMARAVPTTLMALMSGDWRNCTKACLIIF